MPLFIAPKEYEEGIRSHLKEKHPESVWRTESITFEVARRLVAQACEDVTEKQPAVKLLSIFHASLVSIWLGMELHVYDGFNELNGTAPETKKFLFHGTERRGVWKLLTPA